MLNVAAHSQQGAVGRVIAKHQHIGRLIRPARLAGLGRQVAPKAAVVHRHSRQAVGKGAAVRGFNQQQISPGVAIARLGVQLGHQGRPAAPVGVGAHDLHLMAQPLTHLGFREAEHAVVHARHDGGGAQAEQCREGGRIAKTGGGPDGRPARPSLGF
ncbi:hypothetical protein D3C86_1226870 [compost metagenome]